MKRREHRNNRIWMLLGAFLAVVLSLYSIRSTFVSVVALEQSARCGAEEHVHSPVCYQDGVLRCAKVPHTHNRNCYLVLLKDNDINHLLSQIDEDRSHNLETLIHQTLGTALAYNSNLVMLDMEIPQQEPAPSPSTLTATQLQYAESPKDTSSANTESVALQAADISTLNETIEEQNIAPGIVFNEDLYSATTLSQLPSDTVALLNNSSTSSGGVSTLALGDEPNETDNKVNFYIKLNGEWVCFSTQDFTVTSSGNWYKTYVPRIATNSMLNTINARLRADVGLSTNFTANTLKLKYAASEDAGDNYWYDTGSSTSNGTKYTTFGTYYNDSSSANDPKHVRLYYSSNNNPVSYYTVTLNYPNGSSSTVYIPEGQTYTLPAEYVWREGTTEYPGGTNISVSSKRIFTAVVDDGKLRIAYNVNFPTTYPKFGNNNYVSVHPPASPTLAGTTETSRQDVVEETDGGATVRTLTETRVIAQTTHNFGEMYPIRFMGWKTETGELISPNTNLSWAELQTYAKGDNTVTLTGEWVHGINNMVNFFVLYNAKVGETDNTSELYTPSIYATHVGGTINTGFSLDARTDEAAYENDKEIRAMYGPSSGSMWLDTFPSDEYIFEQLRKYASSLTVDGIQVKSEDLNSSAYAIRWYMFKHHNDGWHIDGKLTRKKGQITVDKEFFGEPSTVEKAEKGFYVVAVNGTRNSAGVFTPYAPTNANFNQHVLVLDNATKSALTATYPNAVFQVYDSNSYFSDGEGFEWLIEGVNLDEYWEITEHPVSIPDHMYYAEYSVYDTDGNTTALAEYGTVAPVVGKTFALDEDPDQGLLVDFRNFYYPSESILIKKEDADTGQPIGNAGFELWQYNSGGVLNPLKFSYNSATNQYTYDDQGSIRQITTGDEGYTTISTTGFSYSHGAVVAKEVISPTGYAAAPNVTLTEAADGTVSITNMAYENGTVVDESEWYSFAEVHDNGSVLVVKDHASALTSVTANKAWADSTTADSVTLVLQANGTTATNLFPGLSNVRAVLNSANNWRYTWTDLPTYANGAPVEWSVKEIFVGDEPTLSDGVSFANWTVVYSQPTKTDSDRDGITDHWEYTVTNTVRRAQLYVVKSNPDGDPLPGATFELVEVNAVGNVVANAVTRTGTTDSNGLLHFDNLKYTTRYRLTETSPPGGYMAYTDPAYLILAADGTVTVESHSAVTAGPASSYSVYVVNYQPAPLPETGGSGPGKFYNPGAALMLLAGCGYILLNTKKRGRRQSG